MRALRERLGRPASTVSAFDPDGPRQRLLDDSDTAHLIAGLIGDLEVLPTERGPTLFRTETRHGTSLRERAWLGSLAGMSAAGLAPFDTTPGLAGLPLEQCVFLDLETSGMAGGAGTSVVVLGVARVVPGGVAIGQYLVASPHLEPAAFAALDVWTGPAGSALITFNGRRFDAPVLEARGIIGRQRPAILGWPHLDLLPVSRRLWRHDLPTGRLQSIEHGILGLVRPDDLPGWLVPELYRDVLGSGEWLRIDPVLRHNADDLYGTVLAFAAAAEAAGGQCSTPGAHLAWGRHFEHAGQRGAALAAYERLLAEDLDDDPLRASAVEEATWRAARCHLRLGNHRAAADLWRRLLAQGGTRHRSALLCLAKLAEWHDRDFDVAAGLTDRLLAERPGPDLPSLQRRAARLRRKRGLDPEPLASTPSARHLWLGAGLPWTPTGLRR